MESIPNQLPAGRDSSCSPNSKQDLKSYSGPTLKPNQVSETSLYGIPIVSLVIDGQERLCLAQISNTLLKNYSYNEIHNRRVALGITCVQCTPVQLEILRRAGAMPISSRRCGMISKREAERLCKSFLGAHSPPKLPENFAFDVSHECAWGSRGSFIPARYNSSRAKCIKCSFCNMYFSPNKFIFHSHRTPESKYTQPDAANFNSWRRHLKLTDKNSPDDVSHAWEDVKAMFNGGSRKRTLPVGGSDSSSSLSAQAPRGQTQGEPSEVPHKTLRCEDDRGNVTMPSSIRSYPVIPVPSKSFGMLQKIPPPLFPHPYGFPAFGLCQKKDDGVVMGEPNKTNLSGVFWPSAKDSAYPSFPMFWPTTGSLAMPTYHHAQPKPPSDVLCTRHIELDVSEQSDRSTSTPKDSLLDNERCSSTQSTRNEEDKSGDESRSIEGMQATPRKISYISAFRPVVKDVESIAKLYGNRGPYSGPRSGYMSPDLISESSSYRSVSPDVDSVDDPDVDVESHKVHEDEELSVDDRRSPHGLTVAQSDGVKGQDQDNRQMHTLSDLHTTNSSETRSSDLESHGNKHTTRFEVYALERDEHVHQMSTSYFSSTTTCQREPSVKDVHEEEPSSTVEETDPRNHQDQTNINEERLKEPHDDEESLRKDTGRRVSLVEKNIENMAKDSFQDQMKRELSYREEMVQQLQIVREAHDALHHFSCKMLTPRHCAGTCTFKPPLLPP
uniref:SKI family transcriptional corepressor 1b n=1 Tax=Cyprinus carpio carpio TaxID=630221 RepID=A0A8C1EMJ7_CYPCA